MKRIAVVVLAAAGVAAQPAAAGHSIPHVHPVWVVSQDGVSYVEPSPQAAQMEAGTLLREHPFDEVTIEGHGGA